MSLDDSQVQLLASTYGTPLYVYSVQSILAQITAIRTAPSAFGTTVKYAVKA